MRFRIGRKFEQEYICIESKKEFSRKNSFHGLALVLAQSKEL